MWRQAVNPRTIGTSVRDAHTRHQLPRQWNMITRLGHKNDLTDMDDGEGALHRDVKVEKIGGDTVNRWG